MAVKEIYPKIEFIAINRILTLINNIIKTIHIMIIISMSKVFIVTKGNNLGHIINNRYDLYLIKNFYFLGINITFVLY